MNRFPDFSVISRSMEASVSEKVSLHVGGPESDPVCHDVLFCESQFSQQGTISLNEVRDAEELKKVDLLLSDSTEYYVVLKSLSEDGKAAEFQIEASQGVE
jgi:hypothetical protein